MVGGCLGFLWYNAYPAQVFMGDVGSLSLGAALGTIAVIIKQEILLAIVGGIFVMEAVSVIMQVGYFKMTKGKRIFLMAPFHHHFEKKGWHETKVVVRFWIVSIILGFLAIANIKTALMEATENQENRMTIVSVGPEGLAIALGTLQIGADVGI